MRLIECKEPCEKTSGRSHSPITNILLEFSKSKMQCAEVLDWKHATTCAAAAAFYTTIHRCGFKNISVMQRDGRIFLIKK